MQTLDQIKKERIKKLETLIKKDQNPYPSFSAKRTAIKEAREQMEKRTEVTGRVFSLRGHGKLIFADLVDETGKIQLMFKSDILTANFDDVNLIDIGDFIYASGKVTTTVKGEVSILVDKFSFLAKALRPLPDKWHGLKDVEERYRQRYVDLLVNPEVKAIFLTRTKIVSLLRKFLDNHGFTEVETPVLQPIYGGAYAKPFITHHNALDTDLYLRIADELYLKRLIVGGFEKVYEIGHDFRNEGLSKAHNPEFTMLEYYWAYKTYEDLMDFTEEMLVFIIKEINKNPSADGLKVTFNNKIYDFTTPWKRITYRELFLKFVKIDIDVANNEEKLIKIIKDQQLLPGEKLVGFGQILDKLYKKHIRPHLEGPLFITDYPVELKPLAKRKENDPTKAASFQLLVAGEEFINAYTELNDPQDQRKRWEEEIELAKKGAEDYQVLDEDYIRALEYGMPPTAGWGMGVDRLTAFLTNQHNLKEVILFPTLKPENINKFTVKTQTVKTVPNVTNQKNEQFISRAKVLELVEKNLKNKNLVKHCLSVEAAMRSLAKHFQENEEKWGVVGLMHDADWEATKDKPETHTLKTIEWLKQAGETNPEIFQALASHNFVHTGENPPSTLMEWALYCCDDLTGLIIASTLVLSDKKLASLTAKSVLKKFPSTKFAAGVNREQIKSCEEKLDIKLEDFVQIVLASMQKIAPQLGL